MQCYRNQDSSRKPQVLFGHRMYRRGRALFKIFGITIDSYPLEDSDDEEELMPGEKSK